MMFSPKTAKQISYYTSTRTYNWMGHPQTLITIYFHPWWKIRTKILVEWRYRNNTFFEPELVGDTLQKIEDAIKSQL